MWRRPAEDDPQMMKIYIDIDQHFPVAWILHTQEYKPILASFCFLYMNRIVIGLLFAVVVVVCIEYGSCVKRANRGKEDFLWEENLEHTDWLVQRRSSSSLSLYDNWLSRNRLEPLCNDRDNVSQKIQAMKVEGRKGKTKRQLVSSKALFSLLSWRQQHRK